MSFLRLYFNALPMMCIYSTVIGIDTGLYANKRKPDTSSITPTEKKNETKP